MLKAAGDDEPLVVLVAIKNPPRCETRGASSQEWQALSARSAVVQVMLPAGALNATSKRPRRIRQEPPDNHFDGSPDSRMAKSTPNQRTNLRCL